MADEIHPLTAPSPKAALGYDGTDFIVLSVDDNGRLQIDITASALPTGAATEAKQDTMITALQLIDDLRTALDSVAIDKFQVNVKASVLPTGAATEVKQNDIITALGFIMDLRNALDSVGTDELNVNVENWPGEDMGIEFVIDGGGSEISDGQKGHLEVPFACEIDAGRLFADQSGSIQIDIWADSYANFPPTNADSICGGNELAIAAAQKVEDTTLMGWTVNLAKGDILAWNVDSCTTIERVTVSLSVTRS